MSIDDEKKRYEYKDDIDPFFNSDMRKKEDAKESSSSEISQLDIE